MGYFEDKERLKIAKEVIESDRRTKAQFELKEKNRKLERVIATLVAVLAVGFVVFVILPKL